MKFQILLFFLLLIAIPIILSAFPKIEKNVVNPLVENIKIVKAEDKLSEIAIEEILSGEGKFAIVVKNLKTGETYSHNAEEKFDSASLYKLWVMALSFEKIKDGTLAEDEVLTAPKVGLDETLSTQTPTPTPVGAVSPTPTPAEDEEKISMRVDLAIERMITVSDNYAALLLASRSGTRSIVDFLAEYGFKNSNFREPPQTTAEDIASFYEKLYTGEIVDKEYSEKMMEILIKQTLNDRIPKYLPVNIEVAHKTGELFGFKHDAGIIFGEKGDYIIVVLSETKNPTSAAESTAKFSKKVFDYFEAF